jgi:hypothetical protein
MASIGPTNVSAAFDMLVEEIEREVSAANGEGIAALQAGDYDNARRATDRAERMAQFESRVNALRRDWMAAVGRKGSDDKKTERTQDGHRRTSTDRLPPGFRTPLEDYYRPILTVVSQMGGAARAAQVVDRVGDILRNVLTEADLKPLPHNPAVSRWRNGVHWARLRLVEEGLLKKGSPHGIWEISAEGREYLAKNGD